MFGSQPLSYLNDASVFKLWRFADFLIDTGLKYADSKNIFLVLLLTPESIPPNTPAIHIGSFSLQIIKSSFDNFLSTSSRVVNDVSD